jgi:hypothetical protein
MQNFAKLFDGFIPTQAMPAGFVQLQGERRIIDTALGEALGYERPQEIRRVIRRKSGILQELGILPDEATMPDQARACREFLLNCAQASFLISYFGTTQSNLPIARNAYGWLLNMIKAANSREFASENAATTIFLQDIAEGLAMLGSENTSLHHEIELWCAEKAPPNGASPQARMNKSNSAWIGSPISTMGIGDLSLRYRANVVGSTVIKPPSCGGSFSSSQPSPAGWAGPDSGRMEALGRRRHCYWCVQKT